jgi:hypothetical protein
MCEKFIRPKRVNWREKLMPYPETGEERDFIALLVTLANESSDRIKITPDTERD